MKANCSLTLYLTLIGSFFLLLPGTNAQDASMPPWEVGSWWTVESQFYNQGIVAKRVPHWTDPLAWHFEVTGTATIDEQDYFVVEVKANPPDSFPRWFKLYYRKADLFLRKMEIHYAEARGKPSRLPSIEVKEFSEPTPHVSKIYPIVPLTTPLFPLVTESRHLVKQTVKRIAAEDLNLKIRPEKENELALDPEGNREVFIQTGSFKEKQQWNERAPWALYGETPDKSSFKRRYWLTDFGFKN